MRAGAPRQATIRRAMDAVAANDWRRLLHQAQQPGDVQRALLRALLERQAGTAFGQKYDFARLQDEREYRRAVPIHQYEDLRPLIERQEETKGACLTVEQPVGYTRTSGTTGQPKYLPVLPRTLDALARFQRLFSYSQYQGVPTIFEGRVLVLSGHAVEGTLATGAPYGSLSGLLFDALPLPIRRKDLLSPAVRAMTDPKARYWHAAACALADPELSVIATPNPSTLLKLMDIIREQFADLIDALAVRRAVGGVAMPWISTHRQARLQALLRQRSELTYATLWPQLRAVIMWTGGNCGVLVPRVRSLVPSEAALIEMGYLSSECLGSLNVDVRHNRCVPTFWDHVFEFVPLSEWESAQPATLGLEDVEVGQKYHVVVTTAAGLYRYAMNDIVEVTGRFHATPTIQFVQKGKGVTNITGEKLYEHQVTASVEAVLARSSVACEFYVVLADVEAQEYVLYLDGSPRAEDLARAVESELMARNVEYQAKRESARLRPLRVYPVRHGVAEAYRAYCVASGQRDAQFKLVRLQYRHECTFDFTPFLG